MKKFKKLFSCILALAFAISMLSLTACDGEGSVNISLEEKAQVQQLKTAMQNVNSYGGSYTLRGTVQSIAVTSGTVAGQSYGGTDKGTGTQIMSYNGDTEESVLYTDLVSETSSWGSTTTYTGRGIGTIYNKKNADDSWTQYTNYDVTSAGAGLSSSDSFNFYENFASRSDLISIGRLENEEFAFDMMSSAGLVLGRLNESLDGNFKIDLDKIPDIKTLQDYAELWMDFANAQYSEMQNTIPGMNIGITDVEVSVTEKDGAISYDFDIVIKMNIAEGDESIDYDMKMYTTTVVKDGKITGMNCTCVTDTIMDIESMYSASTMTMSIDYIVEYEFDGSKIPSEETLATYPSLTDVLNSLQ